MGELVHKTQAYLEERYCQQLTLGAIAKALYVDPQSGGPGDAPGSPMGYRQAGRGVRIGLASSPHGS